MLRVSCLSAFAATRAVLVGNGTTFLTGGDCTTSNEMQNVYRLGPRGIRSSSPFEEPNTAIYDSFVSWTYFQPIDIKVDKLPAPKAKYYQHHTKKPWDVSSTELMEITSRRKYVQGWGYLFLSIYVYFLMPKEKSFSGIRGSDGWWIMLPRNQPEKF
ncbi:unnamed protein product [Phytomonas sp. EM1]|nr:unnamed protein product [Phytomonas sp. EM1]|eukprot:CCW64326.1 unnamed protein product [Phytomonas sp. isolate EM1]